MREGMGVDYGGWVVVHVGAACGKNLTWSRMYRKLNCTRINGLGLATEWVQMLLMMGDGGLGPRAVRPRGAWS